VAAPHSVSIIIPSYGRPNALRGYKYFRTARYVVPKSQAAAYRKTVAKNRLIVIPDSADGNIAKKRNWILRNIPRPILMLDDDVSRLVMTEGRYDQEGKFTGCAEKIPLTPEQAMEVITQGFNLAHQWGCVLWGVNLNTDGRNYQQYRPFSLTNPILGPLAGHLEHGLFYDERLPFKEDYDFSLQVLNKHRKALRLNKFAYDCDHGDNRGGVVSIRTWELEASNCRAIERKWGRQIISYPLEPKKMIDLLNGRVNVPIAGV
jgi:hypothetical protein